jgi:hypothetical protein
VSAAVDALAGKGVTGIALRARITDSMGHGNTRPEGLVFPGSVRDRQADF